MEKHLPNIYATGNQIRARTDFLKPWDKNPREITEQEFEQLKQDIRSRQFKPLIIMDDGTVLGGNMRIRAYKELGVKDVWVSVISLKDDGELVKAFVNNEYDQTFQSRHDAMLHYSTRDNQPYGYYLKEMVAEEFAHSTLPLDMYRVPVDQAISLEDLMKEFSPEDEVVEDEVPDVDSNVVVSSLGTVYQLGRHRLMCGDSTKIEDVEKLMNGQKADMVFTDPPYGVDYEGVNNDDLKSEKLREFIYKALVNMYSFSRGGSNIYLWHPDIHSYEFIGAFRDAGFIQARPSTIQWIKDSLVLSQGDYHSRSEPCLYGWKAGENRTRVSDRKQDNVWEIGRPKKSDEHPTMKPIELCARAIKNSSKQDDIVLDLFGGSGSTLIACEQLDRTCYMMELDPKYCDVIRKRYAKFVDPENWEEKWQQLTPTSQ